jgi:hypothetical protein
MCFNYEGMTELINDRFIEDFGILLGSATGEAKTRKSFYEIDKEFCGNVYPYTVKDVRLGRNKKRKDSGKGSFPTRLH